MFKSYFGTQVTWTRSLLFDCSPVLFNGIPLLCFAFLSVPFLSFLSFPSLSFHFLFSLFFSSPFLLYPFLSFVYFLSDLSLSFPFVSFPFFSSPVLSFDLFPLWPPFFLSSPFWPLSFLPFPFLTSHFPFLCFPLGPLSSLFCPFLLYSLLRSTLINYICNLCPHFLCIYFFLTDNFPFSMLVWFLCLILTFQLYCNLHL